MYNNSMNTRLSYRASGSAPWARCSGCSSSTARGGTGSPRLSCRVPVSVKTKLLARRGLGTRWAKYPFRRCRLRIPEGNAINNNSLSPKGGSEKGDLQRGHVKVTSTMTSKWFVGRMPFLYPPLRDSEQPCQWFQQCWDPVFACHLFKHLNITIINDHHLMVMSEGH